MFDLDRNVRIAPQRLGDPQFAVPIVGKDDRQEITADEFAFGIAEHLVERRIALANEAVRSDDLDARGRTFEHALEALCDLAQRLFRSGSFRPCVERSARHTLATSGRFGWNETSAPSMSAAALFRRPAIGREIPRAINAARIMLNNAQTDADIDRRPRRAPGRRVHLGGPDRHADRPAVCGNRIGMDDGDAVEGDEFEYSLLASRVAPDSDGHFADAAAVVRHAGDQATVAIDDGGDPVARKILCIQELRGIPSIPW